MAEAHTDRVAEAKRRAPRGAHRFAAKWVRDVQDAAAVLEGGCYFDQAASQRPIDFFRQFLKHVKGKWAGESFNLMPWQEDATRRMFGWKRADGTRRYRSAFIEIPKKNGKSTWLAAIELFLLLGDGEPGAEVYSVAKDRDQASIVFDAAAAMVRASPELSAILDINESRKTITYLEGAAKFRALSADVGKQEGLNIHGLCYDELHIIGDRSMWDTLRYGGVARRQPLQVAITTAGVFNPGSIGWQEHERARELLAGTRIEWSHFPLIYAAPADADWTDPATWKAANPSWGVTIDPSTFAEECRAAQHSPPDENAFRRYRLNQWTQAVSRWISLPVWDGNHKHPVTREGCLGRVAYGALDLGATGDPSAYVLLFPCDECPGALDVLVRVWVPESALTDPRNPNRHLYQQFVRDGVLETTPGNVTDYDYIVSAILQDAQVFDLQAVAVDRLFQGQHIINHLSGEGITVVPMGQNFLSMGPPTKELERFLLTERIHHGGHTLLRWMADGVEVKTDPNGNLKIVKPSPMDARKVDGLVALVMALDQFTRQQGTDHTSVWESDDYELFTL